MFYDHGWGYMWFGPIFWLIIIAVGVYLVLTWNKRSGRSMDNESAADILKKRYTRGEITREQYEQMKKDITE